MSEATQQSQATPDTPFIIYLTKIQLDNLLELICAPVTLAGPEIVRRGILIETVNQAVPVARYNGTILQKFIAEQKAIYEKNEAERIWAEREAQKAASPDAKPIVANTSATFRPKHVIEAEKAAEKEVPQKTPSKKITPTKKESTAKTATSAPSKKPLPKHRW